MSLEPKRKAMLDSYCHVYESLIAALDEFDRLSSEAGSDIDGYTIIRVCFDPAMKEFGSNPPSSDNKSVLLEDLLNKIGGLFSFKFSSNPNLLALFQTFKNNILKSASLSFQKNIEYFNEVGKNLSQACYTKYCGLGYPGLNRNSSLIITASHNTHISCSPQKKIGNSEVQLKFGTPDFPFMKYINLPFYFLHEYLSHIHSARFFNEHNYEQTSIFEDGWLTYVGELEFMQHLQSGNDSEILQYKEHYIKKFIYSITVGEEANSYTRKGYDLATKFDQFIGRELFNKITFLLSSTDYDAIPEYSPLHSNFLIIVDKWLRKNSPIQKKEEIKEKIDLIELAIEDESPLKSLLDVIQ